MPTFAPGYQEPGTVVKVQLQPVPQPVTPPFVTALIGRTTTDKPVTKIILRNETPAQRWDVNQTTGAIPDAVAVDGIIAVQEEYRQDTLEHGLNASGVDLNAIDPTIVDDNGTSYLRGQDWVPMFINILITASKTHVIEWMTKFTMAMSATQTWLGATVVPNLVAGPAGAQTAIQLGRFSRDSATLGWSGGPFKFRSTELPTIYTSVTASEGPLLNVRNELVERYGNDPTLNAPGVYYVATEVVTASTFDPITAPNDVTVLVTVKEGKSTGDPATNLAVNTNGFLHTHTTGTTIINCHATVSAAITGTDFANAVGVTVPSVAAGGNFIQGATTGDFDPVASATANNQNVIVEFFSPVVGVDGMGAYVEVDNIPMQLNITALLTALNVTTASTSYVAMNAIQGVKVAGPAFGMSVTPPIPSLSPAAGVGLNRSGIKYRVNYRLSKTAADLTISSFDDLRTLQSYHGALTATMGTDYLSLGAVPYFRQGGGTIVTVPLRDKVIDPVNGFDLDNPIQAVADAAWVSALEEALIRLQELSEVSCVIPLSPTENQTFRPEILGLVKAHVENMSAVTESKPRMAIMGARANVVDEDTFINSATSVNSNRVVYLAPATAPFSTGGFNYVGDGSTIASALAGILSTPTIDSGEPISGKSISAFSDIPDPFTRTQKNRIGGTNGVTIIEKVGGGPVVRHFLTTNPATSLTAEGKITRIEIDIRRTLKTALDKTMINTRLINGQTIATVRSIIGLLLSQKITAQIINEYNITKIAKNPAEPRQLDVEVAIRPVFDLNWIYIQATFLAS